MIGGVVEIAVNGIEAKVEQAFHIGGFVVTIWHRFLWD